jgi:hypothetical protein
LPEFQRKGHAFYLTNDNTTEGTIRDVSGSEKKGFSWAIHYGDGTGASGIVFQDKVKIGPVAVAEQGVEAATKVSSQFYQQHSDGLLGLGFGKSNTVKPEKQKTWFENVKETLKDPVFTVSLKKNATGVYDFGWIDQKKYTGQIQYVPINNTRGYWEYPAESFQIGNGPATPLKFQAIADTGTTLMLLPPPAVKAYYAAIPGAASIPKEGGYVYPCEAVGQLPDITLAVGDARITVQGKWVDRGKSATGSGKCYGGIQNGSVGLSIWGDVFLKSQFVVFDGGNTPRIGFAMQA